MTEDEEKTREQRERDFRSKDKLPATPDFTAWSQLPAKTSPFIMDDFRGSLAYTKQKI